MTADAHEHIFPRVICLTLPELRDRQLQVVQQLETVGIRNFEFFPGFSRDSAAVAEAFAQGRVKRFPDCFRCGSRDCGDPDCNNVLLPVQVAVALGFQAIFKVVANGEDPYAAICEDDLFFAGYARKLLGSVEFQRLLRQSGLFDETPTLVRLGLSGIRQGNFFETDIDINSALQLIDAPLMSNSFFLANKAFAKLAFERLRWIDHTADVIIHQALAAQGRCVTLNAQIVADRSWGLGDVASLIHPKNHHLEYLRDSFGESSPQVHQETERLKSHRKKVLVRSYCFTGSPRCGSHFVSAFLRQNGLDIGHESLGDHGICAWQLAASSDSYPYITDPRAQSDFFVHAENWFLYARDPVSAIPSLVVENAKAPMSYAFRRDAIHQHSGVNLDEFASPIERAARAYAHWYLLALERRPRAVLRVESFLDDCREHMPGHDLRAVDVTATERGAGKPYLQVAYSSEPLPPDWAQRLSQDTLAILRHVSGILGYRF